jgi:uncharacterized pyridoxamine 5'-phosphate oxidase family protein
LFANVQKQEYWNCRIKLFFVEKFNRKVHKAVKQTSAFCIQGRMKNGSLTDIKCIPASQSMRYKRGKLHFCRETKKNVDALKQIKNAIKINKRNRSCRHEEAKYSKNSHFSPKQ